MKHKIPCLLLLAISCGLRASAATISVNFTDGGSVESSMFPTDVAGAGGGHTRVAHWNNVSGDNAFATDLFYADGSNSGARVEVEGALGSWSLDHAPADGDDRLWKGYADFGPGFGGTITVSGLSLTGSYDVYIYSDGRNAASWRSSTFSLGLTTITALDQAHSDWGGGETYRRVVPGMNDGEGNYIVFSGISGASFTLEIVAAEAADGSPLRAPVNGIQIVQIPEPSSLLLLGHLVAPLLIRRKVAR